MDSNARRDCVAKDTLRPGYHGFGCYRYVAGNPIQNPVFALSKYQAVAPMATGLLKR